MSNETENLMVDEDTELMADLSEQIPTIDFQDLIAVSGGVDDEGAPNSAAIIALYTLREENDNPPSDEGENNQAKADGDQEEDLWRQDDDGIEHEDSCPFRDAVLNFFAYGNTLIIEADFTAEAAFEIHRISQIVQEWIPHQQDMEYRKTHALHMTVFPMILQGQIMMDFQELIYATLFKVEDGHKWRMVMVFSISDEDDSVNFFQTDDIDTENISEEVELELARQKEAVDQEYAEIMEEVRKEEEYNPYEESVQEQFGDVLFDPVENKKGSRLKKDIEDDDEDEDEEGDEEQKNPYDNGWMRISDD